MVGVAVGVFVVLSLYQRILAVKVLVLQLARDGPGAPGLHIRNGGVDGIMGAVGFGAGGHQNDCIRKRQTRLRQTHHVGGIHRRLDDGDDLRVGKAHILAGAHHKPTAGRGQIPGFQQPGQIVERRIRIGAAHGFLVSRHDIIVVIAVPVVPHGSAAGDLPDVCTLTYYDPQIDLVSDKLLDLSGYDFTDNYVESRLQDVFDNGAIYLLPSVYNCYGITYNKTLLREHGWELPNSFAELEVLAAKAKEAGVDLCLSQIQYPGYGFQYLCNIADADFLGTLDGRLWQKDYLSGKANVSNTPGMMQAMAYVKKWKDIGMLNDSGDALDDNVTLQRMAEGNTLFLMGGTNGIVEADGNADKFGLMPFLSEDGTQNVFVLNVNRFYGLNKKLKQNPQKLEDALKVMRVLSTVAGTSALQPATALKSSLLPFKGAKADGTYYADIADTLNAGNTAPFIYSGWENTFVTTGLKMLDFMKGNATMEDVIRQLDEDQDSVVNNTPDVITTVTEELSQQDCAMLVGRCFAQATGSDLALVSLSTWIPGNPTDQNHHGVAAKLYAKDITDYDLSVILPTGWNRTIQTVSLTGQQISELLASGYDAYGNGKGYPYVLVSPVQPEAGKTYQVAICGVSDQLAAEATVTDSGVVGMDAAKTFFGAYTTISRADTAWS